MAEQGTRTHLSDLVRDRKAVLGLSFERLAQRAIDPETGERTVKSSWLHRLANYMPVIPPALPQLQGLAAALGVPLETVQDAAGAQFLGIDTVWSASGEARAMVARAERMTPEQREQLMRFLDTVVDGPEA